MRDLEQTLDALIRENKFYQMILDNFVPVEESRKLENRAEFDDERETWRFRPIAEAAGLKAMMNRPERKLVQTGLIGLSAEPPDLIRSDTIKFHPKKFPLATMPLYFTSVQ